MRHDLNTPAGNCQPEKEELKIFILESKTESFEKIHPQREKVPFQDAG